MDILPDITEVFKAIEERRKRQEKEKIRIRKHNNEHKEYHKKYAEKNKERIRALNFLWRRGLTPNEDLIKTIIIYKKTKEKLNEHQNDS